MFDVCRERPEVATHARHVDPNNFQKKKPTKQPTSLQLLKPHGKTNKSSSYIVSHKKQKGPVQSRTEHWSSIAHLITNYAMPTPPHNCLLGAPKRRNNKQKTTLATRSEESGRSPAFRHTDKTQRVNLAWIAEQFRRKHHKLTHVSTELQASDILTKPFTTEKWLQGD